MTDLEWARGMAELRKAGLPGWPEDPAESHARAELYRRHLDEFSGAAWMHAVSEAVNSERWFPTVAALRDYAEAYRPPVAGLLTSHRTPEELEADREATRKGLELVKAAYRELAKDMSPILTSVDVPVNGKLNWSEERLAMLRVQAREIVK